MTICETAASNLRELMFHFKKRKPGDVPRFKFDKHMKYPPVVAKDMEFDGDKVIWQMLAEKKHSEKDIIAAVVRYDGGPVKEGGYSRALAKKSIPIVQDWMKKAGVKGKML